MFSNPVMAYNGPANPSANPPRPRPRPQTLNDLRLSSFAAADEKSSKSTALSISGMVLVATLATGAFVMVDPFNLFAPAAPATKEAPAVAAPATEFAKLAPAPLAAAPQPEAAAIKAMPATPVSTITAPAPHAAATSGPKHAITKAPEPSANRVARTDATVAAQPEAVVIAPPAVVVKPEEKIEAPVMLNRDADIKESPKPATTEQPAAKDDSN
jgi:hypothetical protein